MTKHTDATRNSAIRYADAFVIICFQVRMKKLINKIALITGASEGIGLAIAQEFLEEGAEHVFITGRRPELLEQAIQTMNRTNVTVVQGDVANMDDLDRLFDIVRRSKNRLDILVANAGVSNIASVSTLTEQQYDDTFNVNVKGVFFTVQKALPLLADGSSVILIGSVSSIKGHRKPLFEHLLDVGRCR